jgi:hypothetical protein
MRVAIPTLAACAFLVGGARADVVVVPNALANTEGESNNGFPFNIAFFGISSQRYQQVYASSQFSGFGGHPELITQIAFRPDAQFGSAFSSTLPNVRIDLSTTHAVPGSLSSTFANNVGPNDQVVFSGPLHLSSSFTGPPNGPKAFDITIPLQHPFLYNPSQGNLLLDVRNFGGGSTTQFDATFNFGSNSSRAFTITSNGVNDPTGLTDNGALVTQFTGTLPTSGGGVPEPSTLALFGVGAASLVVRRWRRRRA